MGRWSWYSICVFFLWSLGTLLAGDWPQILGPHRSGVYVGSPLTWTWKGGEPERLWGKEVGEGFAGPAVFKDQLFLFHRVSDFEVLQCFRKSTGEFLWRSRAKASYRDRMGFNSGPRAVPTVTEDMVVTMGANGLIRALSREEGRLLWEVEAQSSYQADAGFFGFACSPLVTDDLVIAQIGGRRGAGLVAFDRQSGKLRWKATSDEAGYASPTQFLLRDRTVLACFNREGFVGLDPTNGEVLARYPWRAKMHASVNAATPLQIDDQRVFLSASYQAGATVLDLGELAKPRPVWAGNDILSNHYATSVYHKGYLYGFHGRQERSPALRCVNADSGDVVWTKPAYGGGAILGVGDRLLIMRESGELVMIKGSPEKYMELTSGQILGREARALPAFSSGVLYARDDRILVAVRLGKE